MSEIRAGAYLVLKASRSYSDRVVGVKVARSVQSRPSRLDADEVAVKVNLTVPPALFDREVIANIEIPQDAVIVDAIDAEVEASNE